VTDETKDSTPRLDERIFNDRDLSARSLLRNLAPSLLINAVLPFLLYQYLTAHQVSTVNALSATAVFPIAGITLGWVRTRRLDIIGVISLIFIVPGVLTSLISGSPQFFLIKESVLTGLFGLSFLGSLLLPRPLMFYLSRQFYSGGDPSRAARFEERWQFPSFRFSQRLMTVVWGGVLIGEALIRVGLVFVLPIPIFLEISPVMAATIILGLSIWTMSYVRRRAAAARREGEMRAGPETPVSIR
jgi:hypothetical protein